MTSLTTFSVPVTLNNGQLALIDGHLCVPTGASTVHLLLHGITNGQWYWDLSYQPKTYSYVSAANKIRYATCNIDRLGASTSNESFLHDPPEPYSSDHPPHHPFSQLVTLDTHALVVNQIIQKLRNGSMGNFQKIVLVGHSYGSLIALYTAGRYQSVDMLVLTGLSHSMTPLEQITMGMAQQFMVATSDPKFQDKKLDFGYLTTQPNKRAASYYPDGADPEVIKLDEKSKGLATDAELVTFCSLSGSLRDFTSQINIPVFVVNGNKDLMCCPPGPDPDHPQIWNDDTLAAFERPFYGPRATVQALVVANAGHSVTLHRSAPDTLATIYRWVSSYEPVT